VSEKSSASPSDHQLAAVLEPATGAVRLRLKVVPGASRTRLVGLLGDRLKLHAAAPPQAGQANKAVCKLLAALLHVAARDVSIIAGQTNSRKTVEITGLSTHDALERLADALK